MPKITPISLDGSTLEGGGQLVRVAFSLSAITGIPVHVYNIRANRMAKGRSRGGQKAGSGRGGRGSGNMSAGAGGGSSRKVEGGAKESHLAAVLWLAGRCGASLEGAEVGSREIMFVPGVVNAGNSKGTGKGKKNTLVDFQSNTIHLERPGSVCLILQCILPYLLFVPPDTKTTPTQEQAEPLTTEVTLHGGTNVDKAMSTDYIQHVFLPMLRRLISPESTPNPTIPEITLETIKRGWADSAPQIGEVKLRITYPASASPLRIKAPDATGRGDISQISVIVIAHGEEVRSTIITQLTTELTLCFGSDIPIDVITNEESGDIRRLYILLITHTTDGYRLGRDVLGTGRTPKNAVELKRIVEGSVKGVVAGLREEVKRGGCVDEFMGDQIVVFQTLAMGKGGVNGGEWREGGRGSGEEEVEVGDEEGSLHARTVRWVCEKMLSKKASGGWRDGVKFEDGGVCTGVGWNWPVDDENVRFDKFAITDDVQ